jgi:hypothetical protein
VGSSPTSSISRGVLESKPTDDVLVVTAHKVTIPLCGQTFKGIISPGRQGVKIELVDADLGDILEQIGLDRIFDYWSLEVVRKEVERYAGQHHDEDLQPPPVAS